MEEVMETDMLSTPQTEDFLPTSPSNASIQCRGSWPHTPEYLSDPYQPLSPPLCATVALGAKVSDGVDHTAFIGNDSLHHRSCISTCHEARVAVSGAGLRNNIEDEEDHNHTEADDQPPPPQSLCMAYEPKSMTLSFNFMQEDWPRQSEDYTSRTFAGYQAVVSDPDQPMINRPHDIFGPKITLDAALPSCDSSYATAGAFNEDIVYPNLVSSAAQESGCPNKPWLESRVYKMPRTQARQQGANLNDSEATEENSLMDDVKQFSIEADGTEELLVNAQSRRRFRENCSTSFAFNTPHSKGSQSWQWSELPASAKRMAELHISDDRITNNGPILAPTGACFTQADTQPSTPSIIPSTRQSVTSTMGA